MEGGAHWGVSVEQRHKLLSKQAMYIPKGGKKAKGGGIPDRDISQVQKPWGKNSNKYLRNCKASVTGNKSCIHNKCVLILQENIKVKPLIKTRIYKNTEL